MSELYPFLISPVFDPRPWGALDLSPIYPNHRFSEKIGEAWLTGEHCKVSNGPLTGKSLAELTLKYGAELTGDAVRDSLQERPNAGMWRTLNPGRKLRLA
jgi:mannose-6-phosphate isomerase